MKPKSSTSDQLAVLTDAATEINAAHQRVIGAVGAALEHAHEAGRLLCEIKQQMPHGQFGPWVKQSCAFAGSTARLYMRIHREWARLPRPENANALALSLGQARKLLTALRRADTATPLSDLLRVDPRLIPPAGHMLLGVCPRGGVIWIERAGAESGEYYFATYMRGVGDEHSTVEGTIRPIVPEAVAYFLSMMVPAPTLDCVRWETVTVRESTAARRSNPWLFHSEKEYMRDFVLGKRGRQHAAQINQWADALAAAD